MAEDDKPQRAPKPDKAAAGDKPAKAPRPDKGGPDKAAKGQKGPPSKGGKGAPRDKGAPKAEKVARAPRPKDYKPRMKMHYEKVVREALTKEFGYKNAMQMPRIEKIVLNMGVGEAVNDRKKVDAAAKDLAMIAGQRAVITQGAQVDRHLQGPRRYGDRRQGDAARRPHVRVRGPAGDDRAAARQGLPGPQPQELRRARQLRHGAQGAHRVSRRSTTTRSTRSGAWT